MKTIVKKLLFGKSPLANSFIALVVVASVVLGCTCNDKDGFSWKDLGGSNTERTDTDTDGTDVPEKTPARKADASKGEIPDDAEMEDIVKKTLLDFNNALQTEDFGDFYDSISKPWQKETSPRQLKRLFQKFIDGGADMSGISDLDVDFSSKPRIREQLGYEMLEVEGKFDTSPRETTFELKYLAEDEDWKLASISVVTGLPRGG